MAQQHRYFIINKPPNMVSQFVSSHQVRLLGDLGFSFPEGTHAIGRLDKDSEGLLLLTTNKRVTTLLFQGEKPHGRTYLVKVKYPVAAETIEQLRSGISIQISGDEYYQTTPCEVYLEPNPEQFVSITDQHVKQSPHCWLRITLTEGKFHQVRKMVRMAGHPCMRLIRISIEQLQLGNLPAGGVNELDESSFFRLLNIPYTQ